MRLPLSRDVKRAPAWNATSASPLQSTTRSATIASRPLLLSHSTPVIAPPRTTASTTKVCNRGRTPASSSSTSAIRLNCSASRHSLSLYGHLVEPPMRRATRSISRPMPSLSAVVPWYRYHPSVSMPTVVITPPKQP